MICLEKCIQPGHYDCVTSLKCSIYCRATIYIILNTICHNVSSYRIPKLCVFHLPLLRCLLSPVQGTDWSLPHRTDHPDVHDTADKGALGGDSAAGRQPWEQSCGEVRVGNGGPQWEQEMRWGMGASMGAVCGEVRWGMGASIEAGQSSH